MSATDERWWDPLFAAVTRDPHGDEAWSALYAGLWPYLIDWIVSRYGIDGDAAGDVLQDASLQYRAKLRNGLIPNPSMAHLRAFVRFTVLAHLRARDRFVPIDDLVETPVSSDITARIMIDQVLEQMDGPCAFLLREKYLVGRSSQELARALQTTDGNVRVQLHRCRERFKALFAQRARRSTS